MEETALTGKNGTKLIKFLDQYTFFLTVESALKL